MSGLVSHPTLDHGTQNLPQRPTQIKPTIIQPTKGWKSLDLKGVWQYRDLGWSLAVRDLKIRYKQAVLGAAWAIIQPLVTMVVLNLFFGNFIGLSTLADGVPYPIFLYAGLLPWTFFAASVTASSNSLVANASIIQKVYFPRLLVPISAVGTPMVDFIVSFFVLLAMMGFYCGYNVWAGGAYDVAFTMQFALLPLLLCSTLIAALGVGILISTLTVSYRDFRLIVPFMIQIWFYVTPVIYPITVISSHKRWVVWLNPMGGTIDAFRNAILGQPINYDAWMVSTLSGTVCLVVGLVLFTRTQRYFADVI